MHCTTAHTQKEAKYTLVKAKQDEKVACVSERESVVYTECDFNNDESRSTQALLLHQMSLKNVLPVKPLWWVAVYYEETILWEDLFLMALDLQLEAMRVLVLKESRIRIMNRFILH